MEGVERKGRRMTHPPLMWKEVTITSLVLWSDIIVWNCTLPSPEQPYKSMRKRMRVTAGLTPDWGRQVYEGGGLTRPFVVWL